MPRFLLIAAALSCLLAQTPILADQEIQPGRMDTSVFVVLKAEILRIIPVLDRGFARPQQGTGAGGPDEDRAIQRIAAMAPMLAGLNNSMEQRIQTIQTIATQGLAGPQARERAVAAIGQCLTNSNHGDQVQRAAVEAIGRIGAGSHSASRIFGVVLQTLSNPIAVRLQCIRALRDIATDETAPEAVQALSGVISNPNHSTEVQLEAVDAVAFLGRDDVPAVQLLSRVLENLSRPIAVRLRTISALLNVRAPAARAEAVRGLTKAILNPNHDASVQSAAVEALAFVGRFSRTALEAFRTVLRTTSNPIAVRLCILRVLDCTPAVNATPALEAVSSVLTNPDHDSKVQAEAARVATHLGAADPATAIEALGMCLRGQRFAIATRVEAIHGLARIGHGSRRAEEILEQVLADHNHDSGVLRAAQEALNQLYQ